MKSPLYTISTSDSGLQGHFVAMARDCRVLRETSDYSLAELIMEKTVVETQRIEQKYSRYPTDNIAHEINTSNTREVQVGEETARLINFSERLFELSDGVIDITSGVFRKLWNFDGGTRFH